MSEFCKVGDMQWARRAGFAETFTVRCPPGPDPEITFVIASPLTVVMAAMTFGMSGFDSRK